MKLTGFFVDETGVEKKGDKSVGVCWQYCGNVGKIANSQVAVMGCLSNGDFASIVDARLYLPKDWCDDAPRCEEAGIPEEERILVIRRLSILGMDQFQTRKWLAWYHQIALNIMTMCFMLKEKLFCFRDLPLLSARDIKDWLYFNLAKEMTEMDMLILMFRRHRRRQQWAINSCYLKEYLNLSK